MTVACAATHRPSPLDPRLVHELERWRVASADGRDIGEVVLIQIDDPAEPVRLYRAENASGQWLGYVDEAGRVFQRLPFHETERFLGMYPMAEGLMLLFEETRPVAVHRLGTSDERLPAAPGRDDR